MDTPDNKPASFGLGKTKSGSTENGRGRIFLAETRGRRTATLTLLPVGFSPRLSASARVLSPGTCSVTDLRQPVIPFSREAAINRKTSFLLVVRQTSWLAMNDDWSREQVEAAVADYLEMLAMELRGEDYNKAERNRQLQAVVGRARGSIEFKHQNISAVMIAQGAPYVSGYKPRGHAQNLLRDIVISRLSVAENVQQILTDIVETKHVNRPNIGDLLSIRVAAPIRKKQEYTVREENELSGPKKAFRKNFLEAEMRNRAIGVAGEELVMLYEHERLWRAGKKDLASKIDHVARSQGDGLGYDILSFETSGQERMIEVKTTNFGALTPFFVSKNEVGVSETAEANYALYRLFNFRRQPNLFVLSGPLHRSCELEPFQYTALPA